MTTDRPAALTGGIGLLERALGYLLGCLHRVPPEALSRPTPCRGWDLTALLAHLDDSLAALHEAAGDHDDARPAADGGSDPLSRLRDRVCRVLGAWTAVPAVVATVPTVATVRTVPTVPAMPAMPVVSVAGRPLSAGVVTAVGALEITIHGWDVARACGRDRPIPAPLAGDLLDLAPLFVHGADRPARFGPPLPVPLGAGPAERLLAFLGRHAA